MYRVKNIVHARNVYEEGYTGKGINIAVIDTGIYPHRELEGRIEYFRDYVNARKDAYDDNGHGTHICGIIGCCGNCNKDGISGMAPQAGIFAFKVLDENGNGRTSDVINALNWVLENHQKYKIRLLNFSIGFLPKANLEEQRKLLKLIDELWDDGVIVVAAAGNNGPSESTVTVPGISRKVITVGACDDHKSNSIKKNYSGKGPTNCCIVKPEILAPGTYIVSLSNENNGYMSKSGTSMAAPVVCGALALALEKEPELTPGMIKLYLYESAERTSYNKGIGSWGILNTDKLIDLIH